MRETEGMLVRKRGPSANSRSGYKGVYFDNCRNRWTADIQLSNIHYRIGMFEEVEEAAVAYDSFVINNLPPDSYTNLIPWVREETPTSVFMRAMEQATEEEQRMIIHTLAYVREQKQQAAV